MRKTKIVATLGPKSDDKKTIMEMAKAGMNVARINMSHGTQDIHKRRIDLVKEVRDELNEPIAILLDTRGPEVRLKRFKDSSVTVQDGHDFIITAEDILGDETRASVTCEDFYTRINVGDVVLMCDGLVKMIVTAIKDKDIILKVLTGGTLSNSKSINVPGVSLNLPYLSEADKADLIFGIENDVDFVAASFVSTKEDVLVLKRFLAQHNAIDIDIIAKIESQQGVDNIDSILSVCDGIMVARGDLGVEVAFEKLPHLQKTLIKKARESGKRVITATEMLESMINNQRPTRAETSDVANAVYDGTSAVMLSGETAAGKYPVEAIRTMAMICTATETNIHYKKRFHMSDFQIENIADAISSNAVKASFDLKCSAILVATESGTSARMISRFRPCSTVIGITTHAKSYHKMALSWGVVPVYGSEQKNVDELFKHSTDISKYYNLVNRGETVVCVASTDIGKRGNTNLMKIEVVK